MEKSLFGLIITVGLNFSVFLIAILLLMSYKHRRSKGSKSDEPLLNESPYPETSLNLTDSLRKLYTVSLEELPQYCRDEGYFYLSLLRSLGICLTIMSLISCFVLIPIYFRGSELIKNIRISKLAIDHVSESGNQMIFPAICTLLFSGIIYYTAYSYIKQYQVKVISSRSTLESIKNVCIEIREIPSIFSPIQVNGIILKHLQENFPESVYAVEILPDYTSLYTLLNKRQEIENKLEQYKLLTYEEYRPCIRPTCCSNKVDAIIHYEKMIISIEEEINIVRERSVKANLGMGFLICRSPEIANCLVEFLESPKDVGHWKLVKANEITDYIWENQGTQDFESSILYFLLNSIFIFVFLIFLTPITLTGVLSSILENFELYITLQAFLSFSLPSIVLSLFQSILVPSAISCLVNYEKHRLYSDQSTSIINTFQTFLLLNLIIFPLMGAVTLTMLMQELYEIDFLEWNVRLSTNATRIGEFYINFVVSMMFISNFLDLLFIQRFSDRKLLIWNLEGQANVPAFAFSFEYCKVLNIFAIVVIFSIAIPLIVPLGCLYIWIKYYVDKYNLLFVYRVDDRPTEKLQTTIFRFLIVILALFQLVSSGLFAMSGEQAFIWFGGVLSLLSLITFVISFWADALFQTAENTGKYTEEMLRKASELYKHPCDGSIYNIS